MWLTVVETGLVMIALVWLVVSILAMRFLARQQHDFGHTLAKLNDVDDGERLDESLRDGEP